MLIETERLKLREFREGDEENLEKIFCDPKVMEFSKGVKSRDEVRNWLNRHLTEVYPVNGFGLYAVEKRETREFLGYCGLTLYPDIDGVSEVELGYRLVHTSWGNGYATEAAVAVRDYAREELALQRLIALIDPRNKGSINVARKAGFEFEKDVMFPGYVRKDLVFALVF